MPAILFLLILVFNFVGYRVVIAYMQEGNNTAVEKQLDRKEYSDEELVSIKTTLNLPYYSSSPEFERVYGSVNIKGVVYDYVKRRVYNDTLELLCLPNSAKTGLQNINNDLAKSSADGQASMPVKKAPTTLKISLPDFCQQLETYSPLTQTVHTNFLLQDERFSLTDFTNGQERPPQAV